MRRKPLSVTPAIESISPPVPWRRYQTAVISSKSQRNFWVKSAQIGGSTAIAARHTIKCLRKENHLSVFLSASERQAKELALKAKRFISELARIDCALLQKIMPGKEDIQEHMIRFPNGSRIIVLSAIPETARGYTGDIVLDEYAHHARQDEIFQVAYRQVTLGFDLDIISTPFGQQGRFYRMAEALGLAQGTEPSSQPVMINGWAGWWTDIYAAVRDGLPVSPDVIRAGLGGDEDTWLQEFRCVFLSTASMWIPPELYAQCISSEASACDPPETHGLFAGWDIARNRDMSVIWFLQQLGDVCWTRGVITMANTPTPDQVAQARSWLPFVRRMNIDMTGMGLSIFETLQREYPDKVEGVQFTAASKEAMAVSLKRIMEDRKLRLPDDDTCRRSFGQLKRTTNAIGQARFDADHDKNLGHGDHFWSCALAVQALSLPQGENMTEGAFAPMARPITAGWKTEIM